MTLDGLIRLVDYHYWARDRLLAAVESLTPEQYTADLRSSFPSVRDTLVHLYSAEWIWLQRLNGHMPAAMLASDSFPNFAALRRAWQEHEQIMRAFIATLTEDAVMRVVEYAALDGRRFTQPLADVLQHVVNHGTYHRGQVTTLLRQLGAQPPRSMDLVAFDREHPRAGARPQPPASAGVRAS